MKLNFPFLIMFGFVSLLLAFSGLSAQTFTKITAPSNPVVTDHFESGGGAWIDVNRDGYLDLFVANGNLSTQNNSRYLNDLHGSFVRVTTGPIVNDGGSSVEGDPPGLITGEFFAFNQRYYPTDTLEPGRYRKTRDASRVPCGVYVYRLSSSGYRQTKKLLVVK
ncbi:MAG TPA: VCBS repeat-containing protein [Bacteroidota bacterium]|jgi:hypothetical protein|nr:VCBS repeat-containing protein [Bacteroidota bacterium]